MGALGYCGGQSGRHANGAASRLHFYVCTSITWFAMPWLGERDFGNST